MLIVAPATASPGSTSTGIGFPGEHRLVDRRFPLDHDSVGGDLLPRPDDEHIADLQLIHSYQHLRAVSEDACLLGFELEQRANRCA